MNRRALVVLAGAAGMLMVGACGRPPVSPSSTVESTATTGSISGDTMATLRLTVAGRVIAAEWGDSSTARDLAAQSPLPLTFRDYGGQEKIAALPRALATDGVPPGADPEPNDVGYYAPDRVLVLYYTDVGYYPGIVRLGRLHPADMAFL
ncbi:MAG: cyclophilin-like fold protein, partial [Propionicimonas sp.]